MRGQADKQESDGCGLSADEGFTLLEVLVALTILTLSVVAIFDIFSESLEQAHQQKLAAEARSLMQSLLAQEQASGSLSEGQGVTPSGIVWRIHWSPSDGAEERASVQRTGKLTIDAFWGGPGSRHEVALSTLLFVPGELSR